MSFMDFLKVGNIAELVKNPLAVARMMVRMAPVSIHTLARKRLYDEICAASALLARNSHILLTRAMVDKRDLTIDETNSLIQVEQDMLLCCHRLNIHRKLSPSEFNLEALANIYGYAPGPSPVAGVGSTETSPQARNEDNAKTGNGSTGAA